MDKEIIKPELKKALERAMNIIDKHSNNAIIVGSIALKVCGIPLTREPHDIDILVECSKNEDEEFFKDLHALEHKLVEGSDASCYIFNVLGVPINVWCYDYGCLKREFVIYKGYKFGTITDVLKAKMSYERPKDYQDLGSIIHELSKYMIKKEPGEELPF